MSTSLLAPFEQHRTGWPWIEAVDASIYESLPIMPTVTVLVPSYNQAVFLEECLRSILNQNYPNLEVLLADGGSQDHSIKIIDHYRPYLTWAVSEPDRGTWDADNKALARATGEYIIVVNSDDLLLKNGLFYLLDTLLNQEIKMLKDHFV